MRRGQLYRVRKPGASDPRESRVFVIVSRQELIDVAQYATVICAPVYSAYAGLATQVPVGTDEGLKHDSSIHCDALFSLEKSRLTDYVSSLSPDKIALLDQALLIALDLDCAEPR